MKSVWYSLAFGISVTLHATLLLFGNPTRSATIPVTQGHATLAINLVASVASEAHEVTQQPAPPQPEPEPVEPEKVPDTFIEPVMAAPVIPSIEPTLPALQEPLPQPLPLPEPLDEPAIEQPVAQEQPITEPVVENPVHQVVQSQAPPAPMPTPASVEANSDPQPRGVNTQAQLADPINPVYPMLSRRKGEEGTVSLLIEVTASGIARSVIIAQSCGHRRLDAASIKECRKIRYIPAIVDGKPVDSVFPFDLVWVLQDAQ